MLMTIWSILRLVIFMFTVPMCIGQLFKFILKKELRTPGITFLLGFFVYSGIIQIISILCIMTIASKPHAFETCFKWSLFVVLLFSVAGIFRFDKTMFKKPDIKGLSIDTKIFYGIFFALVVFQMVMAIVTRIFDGDNSYYVTQSVIAQKMGAMYTVDPNKGGSIMLDGRHALAAIPMWIAFIAKAATVHSTIVAYTAWPILIIPLAYFIYHEIAKVLFADNIALRPIFMIIVNMLMIFGNISIYTPATFFLMRTWQGKSMLTSIAFPTILLIFLWMFKETGGEGNLSLRASFWGLLAMVNMFSGMCSEMGVVFGAGLVMLLTLVLLYSSKRVTVLLGAFCCLIPNIIYVVLYKLM
ncbi:MULTISPECIES: DUF6077 domain-containing protein [unclassified Butyrivibrio]|uniref:DUF6077 domain-containing protein n=1 Tax=unclassified Butyrivibrio TaxID=2639466 RepID=UPI00040A5CCE|nr:MULTISPECIES: DUF6077 domain-containing protein [unclassified Butyrivibrio]